MAEGYSVPDGCGIVCYDINYDDLRIRISVGSLVVDFLVGCGSARWNEAWEELRAAARKRDEAVSLDLS